MKSGPRVHAVRSGATTVIPRITVAARAVLLAAALLVQGACYTYSYIPSTDRLAEQRVELRLSDMGRVEMARDLGPGALTVEGRVVTETDSAWTLKVYRLTNVEGFTSVWTGEEITVPRTAVSMVSLRKLDKQRSMFAAAGVTGALAAFILTRSLLGGGLFGDEDPGPVDPSIRR